MQRAAMQLDAPYTSLPFLDLALKPERRRTPLNFAIFNNLATGILHMGAHYPSIWRRPVQGRTSTPKGEHTVSSFPGLQ